MKITIAHRSTDEVEGSEQTLSKQVIFIGRDANECDISFDRDHFPMVSRKHAELNLENNRWILSDIGSTFGTYLNGEKIGDRHYVSVGDVIRFGADGPEIRVVRIDAFSASAEYPKASLQPPAASAVTTGAYGATMPRSVNGMRSIEFKNIAGREPFPLNQSSIWMGRDPSCEIAFDASAVTVSRKHAEIRFSNGSCSVIDNNSFNGTLVNGQRISSPTAVTDGDEVQLGLGGPVMKLRLRETDAIPHQRPANVDASKTMVFNLEKTAISAKLETTSQPKLIRSLVFGQNGVLTVGRDAGNDIPLDGLGISNQHARLKQIQGGFSVEDLNSTNGVFVNGSRVSGKAVTPEDSIQIGAFVIRIDASGTVGVFDSRSKTRVDVAEIVRTAGKTKLLDGISLAIEPNEFIGILGPSGAGKSTLIEAMNGMRPAKSGSVRINDLDLYSHFDSLKQAIGYVPQDDIIHRELSVYRTLFYVAKLRLSRDVSTSEIKQLIDEILDVTGLVETQNSPVKVLSGGQRKRVSIAVELITKPSVIFLDEPTSGLDPTTEGKIMKLFRQIAESGRTVVMTTHVIENVRLFDKIVVLMKGKLVYYGRPDDALKYFGAGNFRELYDKIDAAESSAEELKQRFGSSPEFAQLIEKPLAGIGKESGGGQRKKSRLGIFGAVRQWLLLSRRYLEVLFKDRLNLFILIAQAPVLALMTFIVTDANRPRDFLYCVVAIVAVWFGTSVSAREIVRERPIYIRERMFNLGVLPYLFWKLTVLGIIVAIQCSLMFIPLKLLDLVGVMSMPGELFGIPQFWAMLLTAAVGISVGLFVSAIVRTQEMATSIVPLILIPQLLFSGLAGVPNGATKVVSMAMPGAWSFDTIKRFSTLDTLEPEGAKPNGATKGLGLYRFIESENDESIAESRKELDELRKKAEQDFRDSSSMSAPMMSDIPDLSEPKKLPENLSGYITFLHPWMDDVLNQIVLMLMFLFTAIAAAVVLRLRDIR